MKCNSNLAQWNVIPIKDMMSIDTHTTCISFSTSIHLTHSTQGDISIRGGIFRKTPTLFNIFLEVQTNWYVDPLLSWLCRFSSSHHQFVFTAYHTTKARTTLPTTPHHQSTIFCFPNFSNLQNKPYILKNIHTRLANNFPQNEEWVSSFQTLYSMYIRVNLGTLHYTYITPKNIVVQRFVTQTCLMDINIYCQT
jgi:hypothetical protein